MKMSSREMILLWITGAAVLSGLTFVLCEPRLAEWKIVQQKQSETARKMEVAQHLIDRGPALDAKLKELRSRLPVYAPDRDVTADLLIKIERLANANNLNLASRDVEKETLKGDMYELAATCKWEGKLESLVRFLFDLQNEDAILDISQLSVSPNERKGLRGSFTVYCSYSRNQAGGPRKKPEPKVLEK
jgi:hypothetical protein